MARPLLTIGVTTYDRVKLLRESLNSILSSSVVDVEVIVSNDNPGRVVDASLLEGVQELRVRWFNQSPNLGESRNMNFLLAQAQGEYFTWLADDDAYHPDFFHAVKELIVRYPEQNVFLTTFESGDVFAAKSVAWENKIRELSGGEFLEQYLSRQLKTIGCYGIFKTEFLRGLGGINQQANGFFPYADVLLTMDAARAGRIIYVDAPLIFFRTHPGSISAGSKDLATFVWAQETIRERVEALLALEAFKPRRTQYIYWLLKWFMSDFLAVFFRSGMRPLSAAKRWDGFLLRQMKGLSFGQKVRITLWFNYYFASIVAGWCRYYLKRCFKALLGQRAEGTS